jgi:hypothetical protein
MKLYIYTARDDNVVAVIQGETKAACERRARQLNYDHDPFSATYAPAFGTTDGLRENPQAEQIEA